MRATHFGSRGRDVTYRARTETLGTLLGGHTRRIMHLADKVGNLRAYLMVSVFKFHPMRRVRTVFHRRRASKRKHVRFKNFSKVRRLLCALLCAIPRSRLQQRQLFHHLLSVEKTRFHPTRIHAHRPWFSLITGVLVCDRTFLSR